MDTPALIATNAESHNAKAARRIAEASTGQIASVPLTGPLRSYAPCSFLGQRTGEATTNKFQQMCGLTHADTQPRNAACLDVPAHPPPTRGGR